MAKNKENKTEKPHFIGKTLSYVLNTAWKEAKGIYAMYAVQFIAEGLGELKNLLLPKLLIDELMLVIEGAAAEAHVKRIVTYVVITLVAEFLSRLLNNVARSHMNCYATTLDLYLQEELSQKAMEMDFQYTEDPEVLDQREKAQNGINWYSGGVVGILDCFYRMIYGTILMCTVVVIIAMYCPLLLPVQVIGMGLITYFNFRKQKINTSIYMMLSDVNRIFGYVLYSLPDFHYGKDIRLYNSADMMIQKADDYSGEMGNLWGARAPKIVKNDYCGNIVNAFRDGISYFYMGLRAILGFITVGEFTLCATSASRLYNSLLQIGTGFQEINEKCHYFYEYLVFDKYPDAFEKGDCKVEDKPHVIEFKNVSFKYPRAEEYVLKNINIKIDSKEHLSVVGLNGAGKTTFIKLLCRLYDVTEGEILIDGRNIKDYSEEEYHKMFAVVFQDFKLFAFSLRENIAMGNAEVEVDDAKIDEVLKLSGLYEDAQKLEHGMDTMLFKSFDEKGTELSGGQQQKTAISRALYKDAPIVILDEPTAALDPIAEYEIYKKFDTLVGNKAAIYISHRLSSCKFCDRIAVFADKTIKEYGTHEELVKLKDGIYAEMFKTQAQYYVENGKALA